MAAIPPKMPWAELYVRSGLKMLSDRVRHQPVVRRMRNAARELRTTVLNVARERMPVATAESWVRRMLAEENTGPAPVINATGVIAPRGLALPMANEALAAMTAVGSNFARLTSAVETLICNATGTEGAIVFHSPATAAIAVMAASGGAVVVAREHVGEVGDGVSLVDAACAAGAHLSEIGSLGRFTLDDYRRALTGSIGCLWFGAPQSLGIDGDRLAATSDEVFALAHDRGWTAVEFLEAGTLVDLNEPFTNATVPLVGNSLLAGADLVIFPGDRFLGGPPCGIVAGRRQPIAKVAAQPQATASSLDAAGRAALAATLELTASAERQAAIPMMQLLRATPENLQHRAERLASQLAACDRIFTARAVNCEGFPNDGRIASQSIAGWGVEITPQGISTSDLRTRLQKGTPPVAVLPQEPLILNLRSVLPRHDEQLRAAIFALKGLESLPMEVCNVPQGGVN